MGRCGACVHTKLAVPALVIIGLVIIIEHHGLQGEAVVEVSSINNRLAPELLLPLCHAQRGTLLLLLPISSHSS